MNERFGKISEIEVDNPETWQDRFFLTFDIDWAHDEILEDSIDLVEQAEVAATWFVTHETPILERLRANSKFELGIHPNFNFLLNGDPCKGANAEEVIDRVFSLVPEAKSVRSHSMTQSSVLLQLFKDKGLVYDCNHFIPEQAEIDLKPWYLWNGLIKVPYFWEDDISFMYKTGASIADFVIGNRIMVFDFHPIHVYLNNNSIELYNSLISKQQSPKEMIRYRRSGDGARNNLKLLINHGSSGRI